MRKIAALFLVSACGLLARPKALFYMTENPQSVRSFLAHGNKIDILVPTWYQVDANGNVQPPAALVFFGLCAFVITTIVSEFWKGLRASSRKLSQP